MASILPRGRSRLESATKRINSVFESLDMSTDQLDQMTDLLNRLRAQAGDPVPSSGVFTPPSISLRSIGPPASGGTSLP
jgi:hypothetical protein